MAGSASDGGFLGISGQQGPYLESSRDNYRGRLAPSPTGFLHVGHARTFWTAWARCRERQGSLVFRNEDLDSTRCRPEFVEAMYEDLRWFGLDWDEGPDRGGPCAPYRQSDRMPFYLRAFDRLRQLGLIFPCSCSRKDVAMAAAAPHAGDEEPLYPGFCRQRSASLNDAPPGRPICWRFRVPSGDRLEFQDGIQGSCSFIAGKDFGDFVVWRQDGFPSYQLAVVVDDHEMGITEVVRGADLLLSTARQMLIYRALGWKVPDFAHVKLVTDAAGRRLAKRTEGLSLRKLQGDGWTPDAIRARWDSPWPLEGG